MLTSGVRVFAELNGVIVKATVSTLVDDKCVLILLDGSQAVVNVSAIIEVGVL